MADIQVSTDEFLNARKDYVKSGDIIMKATAQAGFETEYEGKKIRPAASWNEEKRTIRFVMSAEVEDRDRDIIMQAGLALDEFIKNPQAFYNHNARGFPIGGWSDLEKVLTGRPKRTEGTLQVLPEGVEPDADRLARHFSAGSIRTASIGFIPKKVKRREKPADSKDEYGYYGYLIEEAEMVECSAVSIPSNPAALAKMAADGDVKAREVIEEVLDLWAKNPETGLIIPRSEFEAAHKSATNSKTMVTLSFDGPVDMERLQKAWAKATEPNPPEGGTQEPPQPETPPTPPASDPVANPNGEQVPTPPHEGDTPVGAPPEEEKPLTEPQKQSLLSRLFKLFGSQSDEDIERELIAKKRREAEEVVAAAARKDAFDKRFQNLETRLGAKGLVD